MGTRRFQLFSGSASLTLAEKIAEEYGCALGQLTTTKFSDGEIQPRFGESLRGNEVFLVQSTNPPAENLLELLLMIDAARRSSANTITVVIPYFGYGRQDRKDQPRVSIGARLMADVLEAAGASRVMTMDLHAGQIQGFFSIPFDNLDASAMFIPYIRELQMENLVVASPDMGGVGRARLYAERLGAQLVIVDKYRRRANQIASMQVIGDVEGANVLIVDDIVDTAGTLAKSAEHILQKGAKSVRAVVTHPLLSGPAYENLEKSTLTEILVTDTIPLRKQSPKIKVLSIAPLFARALHKIYNFESVSSFFIS